MKTEINYEKVRLHGEREDVFEAIFPSSGTFFSKYFVIILCDISGLENFLLSFSENNIIVFRAFMCSNRFTAAIFFLCK